MFAWLPLSAPRYVAPAAGLAAGAAVGANAAAVAAQNRIVRTRKSTAPTIPAQAQGRARHAGKVARNRQRAALIADVTLRRLPRRRGHCVRSEPTRYARSAARRALRRPRPAPPRRRPT